jgi:hypothetical protein
MSTPFPGMDPYLEQHDLWPNVHSSLIVALRDDVAPRLRPRYYVAVEERTTRVAPEDVFFAVRPDVAVIGRSQVNEAAAVYAPVGGMLTVQVPLPDEIREIYLEIRTAGENRVVTVLEILSPTNKRPGAGRRLYEEKRLALFGTRTHLVEIDLLRDGPPMTMAGCPPEVAYRILISRAGQRPRADLLIFGVREPVPAFALPLLPGDDEPRVELNRLLHELYDRAGFDLRVDYTRPPEPPLNADDAAWSDELLRAAGLR